MFVDLEVSYYDSEALKDISELEEKLCGLVDYLLWEQAVLNGSTHKGGLEVTRKEVEQVSQIILNKLGEL